MSIGNYKTIKGYKRKGKKTKKCKSYNVTSISDFDVELS